MGQVLVTWKEISGYVRKSIPWIRKKVNEQGFPVLMKKGGGPGLPRKVYTTTSLIDIWIAKQIQQQRQK